MNMLIYLNESYLPAIGALFSTAGLILAIVIRSPRIQSDHIGYIMLLAFELSLLTLPCKHRYVKQIGFGLLAIIVLLQFTTKAGAVAAIYLIGSGDIFYANIILIPLLAAIIYVGSLFSGKKQG